MSGYQVMDLCMTVQRLHMPCEACRYITITKAYWAAANLMESQVNYP
jgi:hypothetical protein